MSDINIICVRAPACIILVGCCRSCRDYAAYGFVAVGRGVGRGVGAVGYISGIPYQRRGQVLG